jgi:hypothetical protein
LFALIELYGDCLNELTPEELERLFMKLFDFVGERPSPGEELYDERLFLHQLQNKQTQEYITRLTSAVRQHVDSADQIRTAMTRGQQKKKLDFFYQNN